MVRCLSVVRGCQQFLARLGSLQAPSRSRVWKGIARSGSSGWRKSREGLSTERGIVESVHKCREAEPSSQVEKDVVNIRARAEIQPCAYPYRLLRNDDGLGV